MGTRSLCTKNKNNFLFPELKKKVIEHIQENADRKSVYIDSIDGSADHLHCLFRLRSDVSLADTIKWFKGESSFWINKNQLTSSYFEWAKEYYAASVDEISLNRVRAYIRNQKKHHSVQAIDDWLLRNGGSAPL